MSTLCSSMLSSLLNGHCMRYNESMMRVCGVGLAASLGLRGRPMLLASLTACQCMSASSQGLIDAQDRCLGSAL